MNVASACYCGNTDGRDEVINGVKVRVCSCGVTRQPLIMTTGELNTWYRKKYYSDIYIHTYEHDCKIASNRLQTHHQYGYLKQPGRILDIGSGNGAFIDVCRNNDIAAYGCDPHNSNPWAYEGSITEIGYPSAYFHAVTFNDSLEHLPDPTYALKEAHRILNDSGELIIDFPAFYSPVGQHHWKPIEHIWYFNESQLLKMITKSGFEIKYIDNPIPSKIVVYATKKKTTRPARILVPPGIGDIYWVLCKLESFIEINSLGIPEIWVSSTQPNRNRSLPFIKMFPFLKAVDYHKHDIRRNTVWHEAYMENKRSIFQNVNGFDWFLSANGPLRHGRTLESIMPEYETNWYPHMFFSLEQLTYGRQKVQEFGPYIVGFFTHHSMYRNWLRELSVHRIYEIITAINNETCCRIMLTGAAWDNEGLQSINAQLLSLDSQVKKPVLVDMVGKTSLDEYFALLKFSSGCIGFCGGNTILSTVLKKPTVILWNDYFNQSFWRHSCPPDSLGKWYYPTSTNEPSDHIVKSFLNSLEART